MLEIKATLRISSKLFTLDELIQSLGEPIRGFSIGDEFSHGKRKRDFSYWAWELEPEKKVSLESHLSQIIRILDEKNENISCLKDKIDIDIFCSLSSDNGQGGAVLSSNLIKLLVPYDIDVVFDLYMEPE